jgi:hypothetical protein
MPAMITTTVVAAGSNLRILRRQNSKIFDLDKGELTRLFVTK